jgi:hypothetical protein
MQVYNLTNDVYLIKMSTCEVDNISARLVCAICAQPTNLMHFHITKEVLAYSGMLEMLEDAMRYPKFVTSMFTSIEDIIQKRIRAKTFNPLSKEEVYLLYDKILCYEELGFDAPTILNTLTKVLLLF